jgi:SelR domain
MTAPSVAPFSSAKKLSHVAASQARSARVRTAMLLTRRQGFAAMVTAGTLLRESGQVAGAAEFAASGSMAFLERRGSFALNDEEWRQRLSPAQYSILREANTERPFGSPLNNEKRKGAVRRRQCHSEES